MGNSCSYLNSLSASKAKKLISENKFDIIFPDKNINILIYCMSGNRTLTAMKILNSNGYNNVYFLDNATYFDII